MRFTLSFETEKQVVGPIERQRQDPSSSRVPIFFGSPTASTRLMTWYSRMGVPALDAVVDVLGTIEGVPNFETGDFATLFDEIGDG